MHACMQSTYIIKDMGRVGRAHELMKYMGRAHRVRRAWGSCMHACMHAQEGWRQGIPRNKYMDIYTAHSYGQST
jgi:hypothetical protein